MTKKTFFNKEELNNIGTWIISAINDNIKAGRDIYGSAYKYSNRPFYIPFNQKFWQRVGGHRSQDLHKKFSIIKRNGTKLGLIINGYSYFKSIMYPDSVNQFLIATGKMLQRMHFAIDTTSNTIIVGWEDETQQKKAYFLNVAGAGKGKNLFRFLGLAEKQKAELKTYIQTYINEKLQANLTVNIL